MPNYNSPRPARKNRRNDGYLSKILFWEQELTAYTLTGRSRYSLERIEDSLAYFKDRRAAWLQSQDRVAEGKRLFEQMSDARRAQGDENLHCDGEDLADSEDVRPAKLSAGTHSALMEWAKSVGLPTHPQNA